MKLQANTTYRNSMVNCCKNNMVVCQPIIGCCDQLWLEVPPSYTELIVKVRVGKGNGTYFEQLLDVEDGFIQIDLEELAEGWFNYYGGPYTIQYIDPSTNQVIEFVHSGQTVSGVEWTMEPGFSESNICTLDIFQ